MCVFDDSAHESQYADADVRESSSHRAPEKISSTTYDDAYSDEESAPSVKPRDGRVNEASRRSTVAS